MVILLIIFATVISTLLGGLFAIKFKDQLHLILGFSAGTVIGVALFDLLPEAFSLAEKTYGAMMISILIAAGFVTYMVIDRFFSLHAHPDDHCENPAHSHNHNKGAVGVFALILHSFLDGLGIGLAFRVSPLIGWVVTAGVLAHKFSDGISTVGIIMGSKKDNKQALKWLIISALAPAVGVGAAYMFSVPEATLGLILAVFVGLFLYLSASDLIPESHHQHPTIWTTISTIVGMLVIFIAVYLAG